MLERIRVVAAAMMVLGCLGLAGESLGQTYPAKAIKIVVPFGAGSGSDTGARLLASVIAPRLGQSVVIENKPGASGAIAAQSVARAAPDGYTFLMGTNSTHGGAHALIKDPGYDPMKDLAPVALVGIFPAFIVVHPSVPAKTPAELVDFIRANPDKVPFASASVSQVAMGEVFKSELKLKMPRIPYQSTPQGLTDVIGGRVPVMFADISTSLPHVKSGALRAVAVISLGERSPLAPDVPTVSESVLPNFHMAGWIGLFAPTGTPQPIIDRMAGEVVKAVQEPDFRQKISQIGAEAKTMPPGEFQKFVAREFANLPRILREAGIKPE